MKLLHKPPLWRAVLAAMLAVLALVGFWPSPVDAPAQGGIDSALKFLHAHGIPDWVNYSLIEKSANVALFIPFGIATSWAYPDKRWWQSAALGLAVSGCMELAQLVFLHSRVSSLADLVTNFGGSVIGALLAVAALHHFQQPDPQWSRPQTATGPTLVSVGPVRN